jgi:6-pyruvoyltetrahydropterin/6-carboxytetrahydropterin synthase
MANQVSVEVSGIDFAAAHFVSEGGACEQLHGHNYHVTVTVWGEIDPYGMIVDFRILKKRIRQLCKQWDHFVLLPAQSKLIKSAEKVQQIEVTTPNGKYSFPAKDVKVIDVVETTAEELARFLCQKVIADLISDFPNVTAVQVMLAESPTSRATVLLSA